MASFLDKIGLADVLTRIKNAFVAKADTQEVQFLDIDSTPTANSTNLVTSGGVAGALAGKQDTINDLADIRSGASAGATAYQKPSSGIPASDLASGVIPTVPTISTNIEQDKASDAKTASPKAVADYVDGKTGDLTNLNTTSKNNIVAAINELKSNSSNTYTVSDFSSISDSILNSLEVGDTIIQDLELIGGSGELLGTVVDCQDNYRAITSHDPYNGYYLYEYSRSDSLEEWSCSASSFSLNAIVDKADKVSGAVSGNLAGLDSYGNLTDSGYSASSFATSAQGTKADNAVQYVTQTLTDAQKTQARSNIGAGTYSKPSTGIPASDLAAGVIPSVPVTDVTVGGTSVVSNNVAAIPAMLPLAGGTMNSGAEIKWGNNAYLSASALSLPGASVQSGQVEITDNVEGYSGGINIDDNNLYAYFRSKTFNFPNASGTLALTSQIPAAQVNSDWNASSGVAQILNKPDLTGFITNSVNDLVNYYKKTETYTQTEINNLIGAIQQFRYEIVASTSAVTEPASNVLYLIGPTGSGADKYEEYVYANST